MPKVKELPPEIRRTTISAMVAPETFKEVRALSKKLISYGVSIDFLAFIYRSLPKEKMTEMMKLFTFRRKAKRAERSRWWKENSIVKGK